MRIAEGHGRGSMPQEIADRGQGHPPHDEPRGKGMAEVVEVEIRMSCGLTGPVKAMPHIIPPMPSMIMEDPGHV